MFKNVTVFRTIILILLLILTISMILPFIYVIAISLSSRFYVETNKVSLYPIGITLDSYKQVLSDVALWKSFGVTIFTTIFGTAISIIVTVLMAYPLSRKEFKLSKFITIFVLFTMVFQAPIIPFFLTVKALNLLDTVWALILPLVVDAFNLILVKSFFMEVPEELLESARIDGCGEGRTLFSIILPISKPVLATIGLFYAVSYWNIFYNAILFIYNKDLQPLQVLVRSFQINSSDMIMGYTNLNYNQNTLQMATVMVVTLPIIIVYPFLQKYFIQGATLGGIKE